MKRSALVSSWEDNDLCGLGTRCSNCENDVTYWYSKALTACCNEPKWSDGSMGPPAMLARIHLHTGMAKLSQLVVPSLGGVMDQSVFLEELPASLAKPSHILVG